MDPAITRLHKELHAILDESSTLAAPEQFSVDEEDTQVTQLQKRIEGLFANEAFQKHCSVELQGSLRKSVEALGVRFQTSSDHLLVVRVCRAISSVVRSILFTTEEQAAPDTKHTKEAGGLSGSKEGLERLETLLLRGAPLSPDVEERLAKDPKCKELLLIYHEAVKRFAERINPAHTQNLKDTEGLQHFPEALHPLLSVYSIDLERVLKIPALQIQFFQLWIEVEIERTYDRACEFRKELSTLMSEYEKLVGENESTICARLTKMYYARLSAGNLSLNPEDETPGVTELRLRIASLLNSEAYKSHAVKFNVSTSSSGHAPYSLMSCFRSRYDWPIDCYSILRVLKKQKYDLLVKRVALADASGNVADFRHWTNAEGNQNNRE